MRSEVALLVNVRALGDGGAVKNSSFGNVLELGPEDLLLESSREYEVGASLVISVVFPGIARGSDPVNSLECVVRGVRDEKNLHYDVSIERLDATARQRLSQFLARPEPGRGA
jgi:hypothetical protein